MTLFLVTLVPVLDSAPSILFEFKSGPNLCPVFLTSFQPFVSLFMDIASLPSLPDSPIADFMPSRNESEFVEQAELARSALQTFVEITKTNKLSDVVKHAAFNEVLTHTVRTFLFFFFV